jgi:hypothetical protein
MATVMPRDELTRRALRFVDETLRENPDRSLDALIDEAGARFNLSPLDSEALYRLFRESRNQGAS